MSQTSIGKVSEDRKDTPIDVAQSLVNSPFSNTATVELSYPVYPMGSTRAWCSVAGCVLLQLCSLGVVTSVGVFQEFYINTWLNHFTPSEIGWITGMVLSFTFCLGIIGGKLYDAGYGRVTLVGGSLLFSFSLFMLSLTQRNKYYQVFLSHALGIGLGSSLILTPTTIVVAHHFQSRKAVPLGILGASGSLGVIIYSIMLNQLIHFKLGFPWAIRIAAFISTGAFILGNILISIPPLPPRPQETRVSNYREYLNWPFVLTMIGSGFLAQLGLYFPLSYGQLFALRHGISPQVAFYSIAITEFAGMIGKIFPNYLSDLYGPVNVMIGCLTFAGIMSIALLGCGNLVGFIVFSILYGFCIDACISLYLLTVIAIAPRQADLGKALGISFIPVGISSIIGNPVLGAILGNTVLVWWKGITFAALCIFSGIFIQLIGRYIYLRKSRKSGGENTWKL
ncbi:hypothetical protein M422DRAFT_67463 [Sphaerobolus stellatus SS14]|uniref:Major facilitator superfamily (MFS) profile domain-containing protein n=1 Tax=Sphaerobolus stellatus (strain SS14) TaxID=990650 RepID=A0A0C9VCU8_SPHS4|nr:hypothetical protein M422DRAFT_67463 [Sphaerobolus stellatus SS14]